MGEVQRVVGHRQRRFVTCALSLLGADSAPANGLASATLQVTAEPVPGRELRANSGRRGPLHLGQLVETTAQQLQRLAELPEPLAEAGLLEHQPAGGDRV